MWFIHGGRATGKTTMLLRQSAVTGCAILVAHGNRARFLKQQAQSMGLNIPEPIVWKNDSNYCNLGCLMDDAEQIIDMILQTRMGLHCEGMVINGPMTTLFNPYLPESAFDSLPAASLARLNAEKVRNYTMGCWGACARGCTKSCVGMMAE